jgi:hypothetical protein
MLFGFDEDKLAVGLELLAKLSALVAGAAIVLIAEGIVWAFIGMLIALVIPTFNLEPEDEPLAPLLFETLPVLVLRVSCAGVSSTHMFEKSPVLICIILSPTSQKRVWPPLDLESLLEANSNVELIRLEFFHAILIYLKRNIQKKINVKIT